jgi:hypothetical protein
MSVRSAAALAPPAAAHSRSALRCVAISDAPKLQMFHAFFSLDALPQLLVLVLLLGAVVALADRAMRRLSTRWAETPAALPSPAAVAVVTGIFALSVGFLSSDLWAQQRSASDAGAREAIAFDRLNELASDRLLVIPAARTSLTLYQRAMVEEWSEHGNRVASSAAREQIRTLRTIELDLERQHASSALTGDWLRAVNELEDSRMRRLQLGLDYTDETQWLVVFALAVLSILAIASIHIDRPGGGRIMVVLFAMASGLVLWHLARHTNPYVGGSWSIPTPAVFLQLQTP